VQMGLKLLFKKMLGLTVETSDLNEIKKHIGAVEARLSEVIKSNHIVENNLNSSDKKKLLSLAASSALITNNNSNNVRVRPSEASNATDVDFIIARTRRTHSAAGSFDENEDGSTPRPRAKSKDSTQGSAPPLQTILDRSSVKKQAAKLIADSLKTEKKKTSPSREQKMRTSKLSVAKSSKRKMLINKF
jgi:hypothetical protein